MASYGVRQLLACFFGIFVFLGNAPAFAAEEIAIGVLQPLSGPNAKFGVSSLRGSEMVVEAVNAAGGIKSLGGAKVKIISVDVPTPNTAAAATQRLVSKNKVSGIVGVFVSSTTLAVSEVTERVGVPIVTFAFADQITERGYKYSFQVTPKGTIFGNAQLEYALDIAKQYGESVKKIAILYEDTAYGTSQAKGIRVAAGKNNLEIVVDEAYPLGITDAAPLVNKLRASGAEIVFPVSYLNDSLLIIRTMRQQGLTIPAIGGAAGYIIPDFKKGLGELADGTLSVASAAADQIPEIALEYKKKYGSFMTHEAISHAVATDALIKAVEKAASSDPAKVRDALAGLETCEGFARGIPGGCVKFDANGYNSVTFPLMVQWQGDEPVSVYPKSVAKAKAIWRTQK
ncbi:MAG: ABC transporter substrate-binding protein [Desulfovibrio sp.]|jgi:branched-chain amino acid transport system substrate-binding protein|nr:ABC transporter substrate-binding protein [Desulfovibrio sp.]